MLLGWVQLYDICRMFVVSTRKIINKHPNTIVWKKFKYGSLGTVYSVLN